MEGDYICKEFYVRMNDAEANEQFVMDKEKQISVDPISLKQTARRTGENERYSMPPRSPCAKDMRPLPLRPAKSNFMTASLPSSATSSPRSGTIMSLKKWKNHGSAINFVARQHSATVSPFASQASPLRKSKSCGEGRSSTPSDEFDMWARYLNDSRHERDREEDYYEYENNTKQLESRRPRSGEDEDFKCGACLFLPGFAKGKPVRERKEEEEVAAAAAAAANVISRTVSLEKFECASWASSAMICGGDDDGGNGKSMSSYFDLPLELIRNNVNDAHSPVAAAFVFEKDRKGVLKKNASSGGGAGKAGTDSPRRVRFSSNQKSSPCISSARDDFNAYLQAQGV